MDLRRIKKVAHVACAGGCAREYGAPACAQGCIGCGACVRACNYGAIHLNAAGVAEVDRDACRRCGMCARTCPQGIIKMVPETSTILVRCSNEDAGAVARKACANSCIACGICAKKCPVGAISIQSNHAVIDPAACIACGMCAVSCPRGAIHDVFGIYADA